MTTIAEALQNAADALNNAVTNVLNLRAQIAAQLTSITTSVQTTINNFYTRPLYIDYHVDPANGSDANDGTSYATAKKTLDGVLSAIGTQGVRVFLYGDVTLQKRYTTQADISLQGVQISRSSTGRAPARRTVSFLGVAINSPDTYLGTMSAGVIMQGGNLFTDAVDFKLPDVAANVNVRSHILSSLFSNMLLSYPTITVTSAQAAALFGSYGGGRLTVTINPVLATGAGGHVFEGVASGADPNAAGWSYRTNLTAA